MRRPIKAGLLRVGRWLVDLSSDPPRAPRHPLETLVAQGAVHPSVRFDGSQVSLAGPDTRIAIGQDSMFLGRLRFLRPGAFRMGARSYVGPDTELHITTSIEIGDDVMFAWGCTLIDTDMHSPRFEQRKDDVLITAQRAGRTHADKDWSAVRCAPVIVRDKAWVGLRAIILRGVTLGEGCVVGAGSVVRRDVPPWTLVAGNPARVIRKLEAPRPAGAATTDNTPRPPALVGEPA